MHHSARPQGVAARGQARGPRRLRLRPVPGGL
jgi:hypothetical protein